MSKWETVKLGDICDGISSNIAQKDLEENEGLYPIYGASGFIKSVNFYKQEKEYIAVVKDGAGIGRTTLLPAKSSVIGTMQTLLPKSTVNPRFLYYAVNTMNLAKYYTGATIPHIYFKDYKNELLPLPPLETQQKIADVLDRASALIEKRKAQIEKLDLLIKSQFIEMFGDLSAHNVQWPDYAIVELCKKKDDIKCGPFGTQLCKTEYKNEGVPLWGIPQINTSFTIPPTDFLDDKKALQLDDYSILPNDIVMSRKGNVGKCSLYPRFGEKGIMHSDVLRIRLDCDKIIPTFLMHQLHYSNYVQQQILVVSSGAIMAGINVTKLKTMRVHVPPLHLQTQFADFVNQIEAQKSLLQKSLEKLELNYKSLMQKCFRGDLF